MSPVARMLTQRSRYRIPAAAAAFRWSRNARGPCIKEIPVVEISGALHCGVPHYHIGDLGRKTPTIITAESRDDGRKRCARTEKRTAVFILASCRLSCAVVFANPVVTRQHSRVICCLVYGALKRDSQIRLPTWQTARFSDVPSASLSRCSHIVGKRKRADNITACQELRSDININIRFRAPPRTRVLSLAFDCTSW